MSKYDQDTKDLDLARSMRRLCGGKFGDMGDDEYNHRVVGTGGAQR